MLEEDFHKCFVLLSFAYVENMALKKEIEILKSELNATRAQRTDMEINCSQDLKDAKEENDCCPSSPILGSNLAKKRKFKKKLWASNQVKASTTVTPKKELFTSFDRHPNWEVQLSPTRYKYKQSPVRNAAQRRKQMGWCCADCEEMYKYCFGDVENTQCRHLIQKASKHRSKHGPRKRSPIGFWDPNMPSTQELLERNKLNRMRK